MSDPIRQAIVGVLNAVPNIGLVHAYQRYTDDRAKLAQFYIQDGLLLGWFVERHSVERLQDTNRWLRVCGWRVVGFRGWKDSDETDLAFCALQDALVAAFDSNITLGLKGVTTYWKDQAGLQIDESGPAMLGGVFVHRAVCSLWTVQREFRDKNLVLKPLAN